MSALLLLVQPAAPSGTGISAQKATRRNQAKRVEWKSFEALLVVVCEPASEREREAERPAPRRKMQVHRLAPPLLLLLLLLLAVLRAAASADSPQRPQLAEAEPQPAADYERTFDEAELEADSDAASFGREPVGRPALGPNQSHTQAVQLAGGDAMLGSFFSHIDKQFKFAESIVMIVIMAILNLATIVGNIMVMISFTMDRS